MNKYVCQITQRFIFTIHSLNLNIMINLRNLLFVETVRNSNNTAINNKTTILNIILYFYPIRNVEIILQTFVICRDLLHR